MPNWCENHVEISGPAETVTKFHKLVMDSKKPTEDGSGISLLQTFIPASDYFLSMEGFNNGGYELCLSNWGCKWPEKMYDFSLWSSRDKISMDFETPWTPPIEGYMTISKIFRDLMFRHYYRDEGLLFMGLTIYQNAITIYQEDLSSEEIYEGCDLTGEEDDYWDLMDSHVETIRMGLWYRAEKAFSTNLDDLI